MSLTPFQLGDSEIGSAHQLSLGGLGTVFIGASSDYPTLYDRVVIRMDPGKNLFDLHELMSFLDFDDALRTSTAEDLERLKLLYLFHVFSPREATPFERTETCFQLPLDQLKQTIVKLAPEMQQVFDAYLDKLAPYEILPGKIRYRIQGLGLEAYELGARTLTAALTGAWGDDSYERIALILEMGMLSSETRCSLNLHTHGLSSFNDFYSGGADSVFTQLITETDLRNNLSFDRFYYIHIVTQAVVFGLVRFAPYFSSSLISYCWNNVDSLQPKNLGIFLAKIPHLESRAV